MVSAFPSLSWEGRIGIDTNTFPMDLLSLALQVRDFKRGHSADIETNFCHLGL